MLSEQKKLLFVHIPKTAGRTIREAFKPYCNNLNFIQKAINRADRLLHLNEGMSRRRVSPPTRIFVDNRLPLRIHATALEYRRWLGPAEFSEYHKFAFVRNPFDWQVSLYEFIRQEKEHYLKKILLRMTFDEYIRWRCSVLPHYQSTYVFDEMGSNNLVSSIGKFENLASDFGAVAKEFSIDYTLGYIGKTKERTDWRTYYTPETQKLVVDTFAIDFDNFGYSREIQ